MKKLPEIDDVQLEKDILEALKDYNIQDIKTLEDVAKFEEHLGVELLGSREFGKHRIVVLDGRILTREEWVRISEEMEYDNDFDDYEMKEYYERWDCVDKLAGLLGMVSALYCYLKARDEALSPVLEQLSSTLEQIGY